MLPSCHVRRPHSDYRHTFLRADQGVETDIRPCPGQPALALITLLLILQHSDRGREDICQSANSVVEYRAYSR